jgi:hypothetical protein
MSPLLLTGTGGAPSLSPMSPMGASAAGGAGANDGATQRARASTTEGKLSTPAGKQAISLLMISNAAAAQQDAKRTASVQGALSGFMMASGVKAATSASRLTQTLKEKRSKYFRKLLRKWFFAVVFYRSMAQVMGRKVSVMALQRERERVLARAEEVGVVTSFEVKGLEKSVPLYLQVRDT